MTKHSQKKTATPDKTSKKAPARASAANQKKTSTKPVSPIKLNRELAHREAEIAIIQSVQEGLASKLEMQAIYDLVGDKIRDLFGSQTTIIATFDHKTETQIFNYYVDRRGSEHLAPRPMSGLVKTLIRLKKTFLFNDNVGQRIQEYGAQLILGPALPKSSVYVHLITNDEVRRVNSQQNSEQEN